MRLQRDRVAIEEVDAVTVALELGDARHLISANTFRWLVLIAGPAIVAEMPHPSAVRRDPSPDHEDQQTLEVE